MHKFMTRLNQEERAFGTIVTLKDPAVVELLGYVGYDFAIIDMEHSTLSLESMENMLRAAQCAQITSIVRTPKDDYGTILRVLDAGADAIMVPHLMTKEQGESIVNMAKYRPVGKRGLDGSTRAARYGVTPFTQHIRQQNEHVTVIGMIEDAEALHNLDELLRIDGLDLLFLGPADLAASLGFQEDFNHPLVWEAIQEIFSKAQAVGMKVGIPAFTAEEVNKAASMGASFFTTPPIDVLLLGRTLDKQLQDLKNSAR